MNETPNAPEWPQPPSLPQHQPRPAIPVQRKPHELLPMEGGPGVSNAVVTPPLFEALRMVITQEPFLLIEGQVQHVDNVIHVKARRIERLDQEKFNCPESHDFR